MSRRLLLVADDYGLSPAVSRGIRELIAAGRLSGTGCMTIFPEWETEAARLRGAPGLEDAAIGQHLTLTDFPGLTGFSPDRSGRMPGLRSLISAIAATNRHDEAIRAELDAQHAAFIRHFGREPAYFDGHQHVHFLRPVREWFLERAHGKSTAQLPWLRGEPSVRLASGVALKAKVGFVCVLANDFNARMRARGYRIKGPLAGFYDWRAPETFAPALKGWVDQAPDGALVMCHPGGVDDVLKSRDVLTEGRAVELETLLSMPPLSLKGSDQ